MYLTFWCGQSFSRISFIFFGNFDYLTSIFAFISSSVVYCAPHRTKLHLNSPKVIFSISISIDGSLSSQRFFFSSSFFSPSIYSAPSSAYSSLSSLSASSSCKICAFLFLNMSVSSCDRNLTVVFLRMIKCRSTSMALGSSETRSSAGDIFLKSSIVSLIPLLALPSRDIYLAFIFSWLNFINYS